LRRRECSLAKKLEKFSEFEHLEIGKIWALCAEVMVTGKI
jgi:hypothetical protein